MPYRNYGNSHTVFFKGHVLDDRLLYESKTGDKRRKNIRAMISRYWSTAIPDIRVEVLFKHQNIILFTNENGRFEGEMNFEVPLEPGWHLAEYKVLDMIVEEQEELICTAEIYIQGNNSQFGVISDVDDTILVSHATQLHRKLRLILTKNAHTRLPFKGVAAFYKALQLGTETDKINPIYYVSSSEWNLYDLLEDFCKVRHIPQGVFLLQDLKSIGKMFKSGGGSHHHKYEKMKILLEFFPEMKFVLIGDSGQKDPVLYTRIVREYPNRIRAIYIRDVSKKKKSKEVRNLASELDATGPQMILVENTWQAAKHAFQNGLITEEGYSSVREEVKMEEE